MNKVIYYSDELNDDFAVTKIENKPLVGFRYKRGAVWNFFAAILYRGVATPLTRLYTLIFDHEVIKNRKVLRGYAKSGYFLYGNHTMTAADAFTPTAITFPKKAYIVANPSAVQIPVAGTIAHMLGCVPIATDYKGMKAFTERVNELAEKDKVVVIYPEAHIWPYYTGIRPFKDVSFNYPAVNDKPVFCFTKTFRKRLIGKHPRVVTYIDGPFFPDEELTVRENRAKLRNEVYEKMTERSKLSDYAYIEYVKADEA